MTIHYTSTKEDALKAIFDATSAAQNRLMGVRKAMGGAAEWRYKYFGSPRSIHNDMVILEQQINAQIGTLESMIVLYGRLVQDTQDE